LTGTHRDRKPAGFRTGVAPARAVGRDHGPQTAVRRSSPAEHTCVAPRPPAEALHPCQAASSPTSLMIARSSLMA
jgi:hypothetical protein